MFSLSQLAVRTEEPFNRTARRIFSFIRGEKGVWRHLHELGTMQVMPYAACQVSTARFLLARSVYSFTEKVTLGGAALQNACRRLKEYDVVGR